MKEYWISCEEYCYFRMPIMANSIEEARSKTRKALRNGDYITWRDKTGDGDVEIKGFCDANGMEIDRYEGEDYYFWFNGDDEYFDGEDDEE